MPVLHIDDSSFKKTIEENELVLVDFYAEWCGPCKMIAPILEELGNEGHVIAKMDVDASPATPQSFGVTSIPTLLVIKNGQVVNKHVGFAAKPQIQALLK